MWQARNRVQEVWHIREIVILRASQLLIALNRWGNPLT